MKLVSSIAQKLLPTLVVFAGVVAIWSIWVHLADVPAWLLPRPMAVVRSMVVDRSDLLSSLGWTTLAALGGFACSAIVGISIAVILAASGILRRAFYPYTVFFQTVPIVAIAPLLLIWFGVGIGPVAVCAFIVSVFPVIANTLAGLLATDPALVDLFHLYGSRPLATLWKLRLPVRIAQYLHRLAHRSGFSGDRRGGRRVPGRTNRGASWFGGSGSERHQAEPNGFGLRRGTARIAARIGDVWSREYRRTSCSATMACIGEIVCL